MHSFNFEPIRLPLLRLGSFQLLLQSSGFSFFNWISIDRVQLRLYYFCSFQRGFQSSNEILTSVDGVFELKNIGSNQNARKKLSSNLDLKSNKLFEQHLLLPRTTTYSFSFQPIRLLLLRLGSFQLLLQPNGSEKVLC